MLYTCIRLFCRDIRLIGSDLGFFCADVGLFGRDVGLFTNLCMYHIQLFINVHIRIYGYIGLFCGDIGLFCGDMGLFGRDIRLFMNGTHTLTHTHIHTYYFVCISMHMCIHVQIYMLRRVGVEKKTSHRYKQKKMWIVWKCVCVVVTCMCLYVYIVFWRTIVSFLFLVRERAFPLSCSLALSHALRTLSCALSFVLPLALSRSLTCNLALSPSVILFLYIYAGVVGNGFSAKTNREFGGRAGAKSRTSSRARARKRRRERKRAKCARANRGARDAVEERKKEREGEEGESEQASAKAGGYIRLFCGDSVLFCGDVELFLWRYMKTFIHGFWWNLCVNFVRCDLPMSCLKSVDLCDMTYSYGMATVSRID